MVMFLVRFMCLTQNIKLICILGIGGGPEGVLAASALDAFDCHFQGRFIFDNDKDINEAKKWAL